MADETKQNLDAPKIQRTPDATKQDGVISGQPNQQVHGQAFELLHKDDKHPSGIMPALHESFSITGNLTAQDKGQKRDKPNEKNQTISIDPNPSYVEGLKAIMMKKRRDYFPLSTSNERRKRLLRKSRNCQRKSPCAMTT